MSANLEKLVAFGIPKNLAQQALALSNNDLNAALNLIFSNSRSTTPPPPEPPKSKISGKVKCQHCLSDEKDIDKVKLLKFGKKCEHYIAEDCFTEKIDTVFLKKNRSYAVISLGVRGSREFYPLETVKKYMSAEAKKRLAVIEKTIPKSLPSSDPGLKGAYTLKDFNYHYNEKQELRNIDTGERFFYITENHYIAIGEAIITHIQNLMKTDYGMSEEFMDPETKYNNVFLSKDWDKKEKLVLIIQGSGPVRPGMWARSLCFNESLHTGACLDYIKQAYDEGYGVIVANPNLNDVRKTPQTLKERYDWDYPHKPRRLTKDLVHKIKNSESPPLHVINLWKKYVPKSKAKNVVIVAHSAGGWATTELIKRLNREVLDRLDAVAFTDSVHSVLNGDPVHLRKFLTEHCINWEKSSLKLNTVISQKSSSGCLCVSAGHPKHENTSASCMSAVFKFFQQKIKNKEA